MEEGAVTVDGYRHPLDDPFFMVATQNPFEQHGTYPLPEGQLDRFAVRISLGTLDEDDERRVVRDNLAGPAVEQIGPVLTLERLRTLRRVTREVHVADPVLHYAVDLVRTTRLLPGIGVGASSRAAITLVRCAQATALTTGRSYVTPDDVRAVAVPVLAHRLVPADPQATGADLVTDLLARFPVPVHF
jgi:MoxR-like ATPase